jgi:hypothetical protein
VAELGERPARTPARGRAPPGGRGPEGVTGTNGTPLRVFTVTSGAISHNVVFQGAGVFEPPAAFDPSNAS